MNRYVVEGLARDVAAGKTVVVLATGREARHLMLDCAEHLDTQGLLAQASMGNGREYVRGVTGGSATRVHRMRGLKDPDVVVLASRPTNQDVDVLRWFTSPVEVLDVW